MTKRPPKRGLPPMHPGGPLVPSETMKLDFTNLHFDGDIQTRWDVLLRIVGDLSIWVHGKTVFGEVEFCLVEFAITLANWLIIATDLGPNFAYTSLESETEGLIRFTRLERGLWGFSAAHQDEELKDSITTTELRNAVLTYIRELRAQLLPRLDILQYVEDSKVRMALQSKLQ